MKKVALHNLGCKVNAYETEAMQEMLEHAGYEIVPFTEHADIYIVNTCTVTNIADRKSRQMLHRAKKQNPDAVIVAAGCYAQAQENENHPVEACVDIVIGNNRKKDLLEILSQYEQKQEEQKHQDQKCQDQKCQDQKQQDQKMKEVIDINHTKEYEKLQLTKTGEHTRAYIKVQDGCNQFCSYCIIPLARGRVRSRTAEDVVKEVTDLAENGYKEIVLTGIHLSSYGLDFPDQSSLLSLILAVHEIDGIERIRLGSLEPRIITEEFVRTIAALPKMCPHFHLSLQSGCDATLKRMNRRYTSEEYYEKCKLLRNYFDHPALTTDVIVGFPGETEEEFSASKAFINQVNFYETHIFKYSRREGTKAAVMENQVPEQVKTKRSNELLQMGAEKKRQYEEYFVGKEVEVLIEEPVMVNGKRMQCGYTREYLKVVLEGEESRQNELIKVQLSKNNLSSTFLPVQSEK